jgi:two-component system, OmpR family, sensor histidine kinase KdpD
MVAGGGIVAALALSTATIALLHGVFGVPYPAPVYLLAVLAVGIAFGTLPAVVTSFAAFVLYDFLFVQPLYTFTIADPLEWLDLLVFLAVAIAIGRLAALLAARATEAIERAREAEALFEISRVLATGGSLDSAAPQVLARLVAATSMDRIWLTLGPAPGDERVVADSDPAAPRPSGVWRVVLERAAPGSVPRWVRTHLADRRGPAREPTTVLYRVPMEVAGEALGSLWSTRGRDRADPDRAETRILSAAADQLGQVVRRDRLAAESTAAEIARQSDRLKTALLDSVSHDLRTPLATIRASAGSLLDPEIEWSADEQRAALRSIDGEAERMNRLVRNLLDLSRIEGGALHPDLEPHDLDEIVAGTVGRLGLTSAKSIVVRLAPDLPPVQVDDLYLDEILSNLVENAIRHGGGTIVVRAAAHPDAHDVELVVEDDGPGVPDTALPHLFDKFFRVDRAGGSARRGMGVGLTVVQGLARAMGGDVTARRSELGGLAVTVRLPAATDEVPDAHDPGATPVSPARTESVS